MESSEKPQALEYILILSGEEILAGRNQDRHLQYISSSLTPLGLLCRRCEVIGDKKIYLTKYIRNALTEVKLVIVTGGLGPTVDDVSREAIAEATGIVLKEHSTALAMLEERFRSFGRKMTENNLCQALVPVSGTFFPNPNGTAPGLVYDKGKKIVIALPGPPRELIPMVKTNLIPFLQGRLKLKRPASSRSFHFCCIGESNVDQIVREKLGGETDLTVSLLAQLGLVNLTLSLPDDNQESQERLSRYADTIRGELGTFLYSETDETLEQTVGELLKQRLDTLSVAESCTGGLLGEKITSVPGASIYFLGGVISYSNRAKETHLKVNTETLRIHGAVSRETACEMARGIQSTFQSRWGVAITGIAGPEGGTPEKPVGTVWIAVSDPNGKAFPFRIQFPGDRDAIRHRSCIFALDQLRRLLLKIDPHSTS